MNKLGVWEILDQRVKELEEKFENYKQVKVIDRNKELEQKVHNLDVRVNECWQKLMEIDRYLKEGQ